MQPEQSTSAPGVDALPPVTEKRFSENIQIVVSLLELRISEHLQASNTALLAQLQPLSCPLVPTNQGQSISLDATFANDGGKAAKEPPIDLLNDDSELHEPEFVEFSTYGKVIPAGLERPPRNIDEPRLGTMTDDTARFLNDMKSQAGYDEYIHNGCYAFFESRANAAIGEALDSLSVGSPLSTEHAAAVALIKAGHRTHAMTEEAARTQPGFLRLTKGGQTSSDADLMFAELAHERFCRPRPTAVSGTLDELRQAFVDIALEVSMHAASKTVVGEAFAKATPRPP
jgi:hypothetical protein